MVHNIAPINTINLTSYFFKRIDATNANKNIPNECIDGIHDVTITEKLNLLVKVPMIVPKLVSMPVIPANVTKAPKQTNHARYESFLILGILYLKVNKWNFVFCLLL